MLPKNKLLTFLLLVTFVYAGRAQSPRVLTQFYERVKDIQSMHAKMDIQLDGQRSETVELWYDLKNSKLVTPILEMLSSDKGLVLLNKRDRWISYQPTDKGTLQTTEVMRPYQLPFDSLLAMQTEVKTETMEGGQRVVLSLDHPAVSSMTLDFDKTDHLKELSYLVKQPTREQPLKVQLSFSILEINPVLKPAVFDLDVYMTSAGNDAVAPASDYSHYQFIEVP